MASDITDEMIAAGARAMRHEGFVDWDDDTVPTFNDSDVAGNHLGSRIASWVPPEQVARAVLEAGLAGRTVVEPAREEYIGCHHPAWPDPLDFLSRRSAEEWFEENRERFPLIEVKRRVVSEWETVLDASGSVGSETPAGDLNG